MRSVSSARLWLLVRVAQPPPCAGTCLSVTSPWSKETLLRSSQVRLYSCINVYFVGAVLQDKDNLPGANLEISAKSTCSAGQIVAETVW